MSRAGTILRVDLTKGQISKEPTSLYVKDYIGGAAIGSKIIYDGVPPEVTALDPRNMLTFNAGPLTGTLLGNKCEVMARAPELTNNPIGCAGMGGQFPSEMKFAGYDNIVIQGRADAPVYLFINNDDIEIRDAKYLWGLDTAQTQVRIKQELKDPDVQIACIGPAGENLNVYAMILHDIQNTAGKRGFGAVMGSKNLKAVAVRGSKGLKVADPEAFMALWKDNWEYYTQAAGPSG
jgi:aldehyde:ferredoxin oxidoreductase